jgi:Glycosyl hydrolases family 2, TIM barrel domain/Glycosyl hydrolases family 2, sugar binding domain/Glycosyl hydrolases family 2
MPKLAATACLILLLGMCHALADGTNLARLGTASAVSVWHNSPDMVPQAGIDGRMETRWGSEERHGWFQIEWQTPQAFRGVVMRNYDASWNKNIPFTCQVWDPSLNAGKGDFRNVQTVTPTSPTVVFTFPEVTTTKLRVTNVITFWELEVYDDAKTLENILDAAGRLEIAAAGDLRGHLLGSVSHEAGTAVAKAAVEVAGHDAEGSWKRQATTDENGLFSVDLPLGVTGRLDIAAHDGATSAKVAVESGDIARQLTPQSPAARSRMSLVGKWDFLADPPPGFSPIASTAKWSRINVPSHWEMEGFVAETGRAVYQRKFALPGAWRGKRTKFRAEGIYSKAEVWVNGQRMGSHDGGATPVELDISAAAKPGAENLLTILVTDHSDADDLSAMSFYAHFNLGGIWRPLEVFCVEPAHISRLAVETRFDSAVRDAELELNLDLVNEQARTIPDAQVSVRLFDPKGREVSASGLSTNLSLGNWERRSVTLRTKVLSPEKWSAETPTLYTLKARLTAAGSHPADVEQRFGFKEVKIVGRTFTFNGQPVKLWGACRHDTDPLAGRAISKTTAWRDIELMKGANLNAMRTSHYPPHPEALNAADELGLYVEDEAPFCWANAGFGGRTRNVVGDARLAPLCLQLASELVERDRNHPSVIIWSVCNESAYGGNLELAHQLIKRSDPARPNSAGQSANLDLATYHNPTSMQRLKDTADFQMPCSSTRASVSFRGSARRRKAWSWTPACAITG